MVAVRSAHLNKAGEFDPQKWIASLGISSQQSCERLTETWAYCLRTTQGHPDADLLLWRGSSPSRMRTWSAKTCCATASENPSSR